jgi:hypothetical protein
MPYDPLNLGAAANDRTGDRWRAGGQKINTMFAELFGVVDSIGLTFIGQESDFPVQDSSTITLESQHVYLVTAAITTAKKFTVEDGAVITALNILGPTLKYSGTGTMFTGTDATFTIREIQIDHPNAQGFSFTDTVGGNFLFINEKVRTVSGTKYGTFDNMQTVLIEGSSALSMGDGISFVGASWIVMSIDKFFIGTASAAFIGVDLGTATSSTIEFTNLIVNGPVGAFGISGLANSGNVPVGRLAMVNASEFGGGLTPLQNITNKDVRWLFNGNSPIGDTIEDSLLSLNNNATETVIAVVNTPVKVAGTFVTERESLFTSDASGTVTYIGERDVVIPVDIAATLRSASGTNKDVTLYLALNGTVIANSAKGNRVGVTDPRSISVPWQLSLSENDFLDIFAENNSDAINLVIIDAVLRVR